jgi:hypothetical protein
MKFPEQFRLKKKGHLYHSNEGEQFGCFEIPGRHARGRALTCIAVDGRDTGWEHVSVSVADSKKPPSWDEMCAVKSLFWDDDECIVQFHPRQVDYVNLHPGVLHLWRSVLEPFPMPPIICV